MCGGGFLNLSFVKKFFFSVLNNYFYSFFLQMNGTFDKSAPINENVQPVSKFEIYLSKFRFHIFFTEAQ